jgi:hypothetical protein
MASQLRCTSKSVDLLYTRKISFYKAIQNARATNVLCGKEEHLEGCCNQGALRQRGVEIRHWVVVASSSLKRKIT